MEYIKKKIPLCLALFEPLMVIPIVRICSETPVFTMTSPIQTIGLTTWLSPFSNPLDLSKEYSPNNLASAVWNFQHRLEGECKFPNTVISP